MARNLLSTELSDDVTLWLKFSDDWIPTLTIPSQDISKYTLRPLKWLRFLGFAIYGREGVLHRDRAGSQVDDYTISAESLQDSYYYSSPESPRLLDIEGLDDRTSDALSSTQSSDSITYFSHELFQRDRTCVLTDAERMVCDAAHLIPHSKGDAYIERFTAHRSHTDEDIIQEINDPRNGLILVSTLHRLLGCGYAAFLKTPNFALCTDEVPPSTLPVSGPSGRLTIQYFCDFHPAFVAQPNQDARPPDDLTQWPPSVITDFNYACAAVREWGSKTSIEKLKESIHKLYYNDPPVGNTTNEKEEQKKARSDRFEARIRRQEKGKDVDLTVSKRVFEDRKKEKMWNMGLVIG